MFAEKEKGIKERMFEALEPLNEKEKKLNRLENELDKVEFKRTLQGALIGISLDLIVLSIIGWLIYRIIPYNEATKLFIFLVFGFYYWGSNLWFRHIGHFRTFWNNFTREFRHFSFKKRKMKKEISRLNLQIKQSLLKNGNQMSCV